MKSFALPGATAKTQAAKKMSLNAHKMVTVLPWRLLDISSRLAHTAASFRRGTVTAGIKDTDIEGLRQLTMSTSRKAV